MELMFFITMLLALFSLSFEKRPEKQKIVVHPEYWKYNRQKLNKGF